MTLPFTWILIVHYKIINWPGFNTVLSPETEALEKRERQRAWPDGGIVRTHIYWLLTAYMGTVCGSSNQLQ